MSFHIPGHKFIGPAASGPASAPAGPASFKVEVIADGSGKWCGNGCRYPTKEVAETMAADLMNRWFAVREWRVVESSDPANYDIVDGKVVGVGANA